ncbi:hypothetical protein NP233_g10288 [Leucocoprinus birnbaumii]|uniref:DUF6697 domain-containing protein n=1 Tax=Leucocoprinus birnbaumii TaxID=56174 RepID=A0AAD5VL16_9AGAR|nr:hypothetical protein NP233_g10288 [Leucocoprinus birnbaumii]
MLNPDAYYALVGCALSLVHSALDYDGPGMDDEFFASVLKKWADSSQEVVDLKKRLTEVEQERNGYQREVGQLRARTHNRRQSKCDSIISSNCGDGEVLDLDEVGDKLEKARLEYQRRLKELDDARDRERTLKQEVEELKKERMQLQSEIQTNRTRNVQASSDLSSLRMEKDNMSSLVADLRSKLQQAEQTNAGHRTKAPEVHNMDAQHVLKLQEQMTSLETQASDKLGLETENASLREDLTNTRESLQKAKESNKSLRTTISQLSQIARNVAGASDGASSVYHDSPSARTSVEVPRILGVPSIPEDTKPVAASSPVKQEPKVEVDLSFNDVTIVAEPTNEPLTPISSHRQEALASLPVVIPDTDINDEENKFTRGFTSAAIGGSIQSLIVRVTSSGTDLAKGRNIEEYLCPRLDHNPWCPSNPGQHGYMFVGLSREKDTYTTPKMRNLFVGLPKRSHKDERFFRYLGVYRVSRVDPLSVNEWKTLHHTVKQNYVHATKEKNKDPRTEEEISAAYDSGELSAPCVKLECVDFDEELYAGLLAFRAKHGPTGRISKRSRDNDYEDNVPLQRTRRISTRRAVQQ